MQVYCVRLIMGQFGSGGLLLLTRYGCQYLGQSRGAMKRVLVSIVLLAMAASALANGAMGLALEMFEFKTWFVYVAAMLIIEAWMIGRWIGVSWPASFGLAISANAFTAFCCPSVLTPFLHYSMVGTQANPNPFWNAVALLTGFAFVSAFFESFFWVWSAHKRQKEWVMWRVLLAHLLGVPLALVILLIPPRPYVGLEAFARAKRRAILRAAMKSLKWDMSEHPMPDVKTSEDLVILYSRTSFYKDVPDTWAAAYDPEFSRFATGEDRRIPFELNRALIGKSAKDVKSRTWLLRLKRADGSVQGYVVTPVGSGNFHYVEIEGTSNSQLLGYTPVH